MGTCCSNAATSNTTNLVNDDKGTAEAGSGSGGGELTAADDGRQNRHVSPATPNPIHHEEEEQQEGAEISPYLKQRFVVSDEEAEEIQDMKEEKGHLAFNVHGSFSSGATRELLQLLVKEVKRAGGNFTAAHIANASNWQEVWGNKLEVADRVIVVWDKAYKARFTVNCRWEHDLIYDKATRYERPICVHFVDDAALESPEKLRAWLGRIVKDDRPGGTYLKEEERDDFIAANMDTATLEEWHAWCRDPNNRCDLDPSARGEALREVETQIAEEVRVAEEAVELKKNRQSEIIEKWGRCTMSAHYDDDGQFVLDLPWERDTFFKRLGAELVVLEKKSQFLRSTIDTYRRNVAAREAREGPSAAQPVEEDLGLTPTGAVVNANPPLRRLVQNGNVDQVRSALNNGADVNEADTFHMTAAHYAAQNGHDEVLKLLIERGANVIDATTKYGFTPIYLAAGLENMNCVKILTKAGARMEDAVSTENLESALRDAVKEGDVDTVQTMIDNGVVDLNAGAPEDGRTALIVTAKEGKVECLEVLVAGGADVNVADDEQWTALMNAADKGSAECVDLLIKAGADLNLTNRVGWTALMYAVFNGSPECVDLLIKAGADLDMEDKDRETALVKAVKEMLPQCVNLLIKGGADLNLQDSDFWTALMHAAKIGQPECVDLLIKAGADLNRLGRGVDEVHEPGVRVGVIYRTPLQGTALMWALKNGSQKCAESLVQAGADLNVKDKTGTALVWAAALGNPDYVEMLIRAGADPNLTTQHGVWQSTMNKYSPLPSPPPFHASWQPTP